MSNRPRHAAALEQRHSTGKGLLHADGASRGNIFTGDADDAVLTMASAGRKHGRIGAGYYAYFSHPYATMRTLLGVLADAAREVHQAAVQRRRDVRPRVHRGGVYPLLRGFTTVLTRDVIVATLVGDMRAGRSVVYADFVGYDEVAHHSGVERYDALETLRRLDREFARLERAAAGCARPTIRRAVRPRPESGRDVPHALWRDPSEVVVPAPSGTDGRHRRAGASAAGEESWGYAGGALRRSRPGRGWRPELQAGNRHRSRR